MFKFVCVALLVAMPALADTWSAKVVGVHDGDTITVLRNDHDQAKIRLNQIDAPELKQAFGNVSKKALSNLVFGRLVTIEAFEQDKYGRTIGTVFVDGVDANREMVKLGMAWAYRKYLKDTSLLQDEEAARNNRLGLWDDPKAMPPWEWRHRGKNGDHSTGICTNPPESVNPPIVPMNPQVDTVKTSHQCGAKRFCKQMESCEEARFHLEQCGLSQLDRDGDGVPCENVCGS